MTTDSTKTPGAGTGGVDTAAPTLPTAQAAPLLAALLVAVFAFQLNASMLSPALATMTRELNTTDAAIGMSQTAFFTAAALFSLFLPRWGDLVGRKKILLGMLLVTGLGCVISALAQGVTMLFIGRIIQGVAGPVVPLCLIMLRAHVANDKQYALLMAILTSINGGIAGVDALAGGWLADHLGFRSIFWTMAIICAIAAVAIFARVGETFAEVRMPMDWAGTVPLVVALAGILLAFNEAGKLADANWVLAGVELLIGIVAFVVFWKVESASTHPLVSTHYLAQRRTWALLLTTTLTMTGVFAVMNGLVPNLAQAETGANMSADVVSWWTLTPYALAGLLMGPIAGRMAAGMGYIRVLQIGLLGTVVGLGALATMVDHITGPMLLGVSIFVGITYAGITNIMLNGLGIVLSPADNQGYLPGMNAGAFNMGAGLSFAVLFAVLTATDFRIATLAGMGILLAALAASFLIPKPETLAA
ncbi:MFS transporter [Corynebacterium sp. 13CS0277]|uniref:uridine transporter UriT n=1 Tax=Corynebacterium sp. 13CS0277 TaxID=2071994 RepID=UPI000D042F15|nr:MFS transporter [Corynebacterium sp. 13CS0277]PRQ12329.1 MFS transporter [Corynebacterium sp. 13CS0277]